MAKAAITAPNERKGEANAVQIQQILESKGTAICVVPRDETIGEIVKILVDKRIGTVLVTEHDNSLAGILSERDVIKYLALHGANALELRAEEVMTQQVVTCTAESALEYVLEQMSVHSIRHLPVVHDKAPVGIISARDVLDAQRELLIKDIERRQQAEQTILDAKEAAEISSRAKTEFLANMSHELRTPLHSVIGFAEVIASESGAPLKQAEINEYSLEIRDAGQNLLEILNDILEMSRIDSGDRTLIDEEVDILEAVGTCSALISARASKTHHRVSSEVPALLPLLWADRRMVQQMLVNLATNAIKFSADGSAVVIRASLEESGGLTISVSDTGVGIPADKIAAVLKPFAQVDGSLKRRNEGTGLGLALVDAMMTLHDGIIDIDSTLGRGTTVSLRFPIHRCIGPAQSASIGN